MKKLITLFLFILLIIIVSCNNNYQHASTIAPDTPGLVLDTSLSSGKFTTNNPVEDSKTESKNSINVKHKYSFVDSYAGVSALLDLWTDKDYTQAASGGIHGRGSYSLNGDTLHFTSTSGISLTGDAKIDLDKNNNIILTILSTGVRYVQDDNGYYIKKNISTTNGTTQKQTSYDSQCPDMDSYNLGYSYAKDQLGGGLVADCDYLYQIAVTQSNNVDHYCFCKGVSKWLSDNNRSY